MKVEVTNNGQFSRAFKVSGGFVEVKPGETATLEPMVPIGEIEGVEVKEVAEVSAPKSTSKTAAPAE